MRLQIIAAKKFFFIVINLDSKPISLFQDSIHPRSTVLKNCVCDSPPSPSESMIVSLESNDFQLQVALK